MNTIEAIYEKGVFRPIEKIELTEGERVKITVEVTVKPKKDVAEDFSDIAQETGISDLALNIDHYLYGLPKQK
ncbi:MAG: antitoxin family protein [Acidobacteria bacterium]|nr:antitoxin family protein [Acidobacteriota bacterium]